MNMGYAIVPFVAWLIAGSTKFLINSIKARKWAFSQIGYGGLPSTHSAIVSSAVALIVLREGLDTPVFCVAITLAFIVFLDAHSLRGAVGRQAQAINHLVQSSGGTQRLRERMGHTRLQIAAGVVVGIISALLVQSLERIAEHLIA